MVGVKRSPVKNKNRTSSMVKDCCFLFIFSDSFLHIFYFYKNKKSFFVSFVRSSFSKFVIREIEKKVETGAKSASPAKRDRLAFYYFAQVQC